MECYHQIGYTISMNVKINSIDAREKSQLKIIADKFLQLCRFENSYLRLLQNQEHTDSDHDQKLAFGRSNRVDL